MYIYRPQRSWAKVIFSQACVCPQGGRGVCLSACWDIPPGSRPPLGADPPCPPPRPDPPGTRPPQEQTTPREQTPPRADTPPEQTPPLPGSRLQHTVNERPVRILLECILVSVLLLLTKSYFYVFSLFALTHVGSFKRWHSIYFYRHELIL